MELRGAELGRLLDVAGHRDAARAAATCESVVFSRTDARAFADVYRTRAQIQEYLRRYEVATDIRRVLSAIESHDVPQVAVGLLAGPTRSYVLVLTDDGDEVVGVVATPAAGGIHSP